MLKLNFLRPLFPLAGAVVILDRSSGGGTRKKGDMAVLEPFSASQAIVACNNKGFKDPGGGVGGGKGKLGSL